MGSILRGPQPLHAPPPTSHLHIQTMTWGYGQFSWFFRSLQRLHCFIKATPDGIGGDSLGSEGPPSLLLRAKINKGKAGTSFSMDKSLYLSCSPEPSTTWAPPQSMCVYESKHPGTPLPWQAEGTVDTFLNVACVSLYQVSSFVSVFIQANTGTGQHKTVHKHIKK